MVPAGSTPAGTPIESALRRRGQEGRLDGDRLALEARGITKVFGNHVALDAVPDIFSAMAAGEANATVELTPNMAGPAFDALQAFWDAGTAPEKFIITESKLYTAADDPQGEYERRKGLGY